MLGNCEMMVVIPSTSNEWPQNQIDEKGVMMASVERVMEKPSQDQQQPLKCPRCDSSNTKFCYYNNYSLTQPRHFCKACKRYWTRGGTLRNVPVGGGCRKNKRAKRPASTGEATSSSAPTATTTNSNVQPQIDLSSTGTHINPLFYSLLTNPSELNLTYPRFNSRVSNVDTVGYDLQQPQMNGIDLGFSSGLLASDTHSNEYRNGFHSNKQIQDIVSSNSLLSSYNPIFGSASTSTSTMASLIASSFQQQKLTCGGFKDDDHQQAANNFQGFGSYDEAQMPRNAEGCLVMKDVKMEESFNRLDWNVPNQNVNIDHQIHSDPSLLWSTTTAGAWLDPSNIGSSVPSLI